MPEGSCFYAVKDVAIGSVRCRERDLEVAKLAVDGSRVLWCDDGWLWVMKGKEREEDAGYM